MLNFIWLHILSMFKKQISDLILQLTYLIFYWTCLVFITKHKPNFNVTVSIIFLWVKEGCRYYVYHKRVYFFTRMCERKLIVFQSRQIMFWTAKAETIYYLINCFYLLLLFIFFCPKTEYLHLMLIASETIRTIFYNNFFFWS